jgi:hypothetical protein
MQCVAEQGQNAVPDKAPNADGEASNGECKGESVRREAWGAERLVGRRHGSLTRGSWVVCRWVAGRESDARATTSPFNSFYDDRPTEVTGKLHKC